MILSVAGYSWATETHPTYDGPPEGTAECEDGWISYSASIQGTCSWHGGVESWNDE